jgi:hypothetical protein
MLSVPRSLTSDKGPTGRWVTFPVILALSPSLARGGEGGGVVVDHRARRMTALRPVCVLGVDGQMEGDGCALVDVSIVLSCVCKNLRERGNGKNGR